MSLLPKGLSGKSSDSGGSNGNNSDNSALVSIGNTSFGFNFDSEEGTMNNSPRISSNSNSEEGDSDDCPKKRRGMSIKNASRKNVPPSTNQKTSSVPKVSSGSETSSSAGRSHSDAAAEAVANLQSIANESNSKTQNAEDAEKDTAKRKVEEFADNDSGGYNSDDEGKTSTKEMEPNEVCSRSVGSESGSQKHPRKKKKLDDMKREERNAREKERSFRISKQINDLRNLLSSGGVIVPKGTKSSVLTEAANYIRMLQQHQYRSEIDRHQLVQQIQMIGGGALGDPAAQAVRHVAAQNGVWSLGNFGGVPPKSAMMYHQPNATSLDQSTSSQTPIQSQDSSVLPSKLTDPDYRFVFNSSTVGMAIASMGGAFIDCNNLFCLLSEYSKQEICSMTIFNITARQDLQHAFDLISQMLAAPSDPNGNPPTNSCVLQGSLKNRTDLGLSITLIKGEDGIAKCFCVTLVVNSAAPYGDARPLPATIEHVQNSGMQMQKAAEGAVLDESPAYTAG